MYKLVGIIFRFNKAQHIPGKSRHMGKQFLLGNKSHRTGFDVDDPYTASPVNDLWHTPVVPASKNIDLVTYSRQMLS